MFTLTLTYELKSGIANDGEINGGVSKERGKLLSVGITANSQNSLSVQNSRFVGTTPICFNCSIDIKRTNEI